jgi:hypothetical protein
MDTLDLLIDIFHHHSFSLYHLIVSFVATLSLYFGTHPRLFPLSSPNSFPLDPHHLLLLSIYSLRFKPNKDFKAMYSQQQIPCCALPAIRKAIVVELQELPRNANKTLRVVVRIFV